MVESFSRVGFRNHVIYIEREREICDVRSTKRVKKNTEALLAGKSRKIRTRLDSCCLAPQIPKSARLQGIEEYGNNIELNAMKVKYF